MFQTPDFSDLFLLLEACTHKRSMNSSQTRSNKTVAFIQNRKRNRKRERAREREGGDVDDDDDKIKNGTMPTFPLKTAR